MTTLTDQQCAWNSMLAAAHLLTGKPGQVDALMRQMNMIVGGGLAPAGLTSLLDMAWRSGRPVLHISWVQAGPPVPRIALACHIGGQARILESLGLWMPQSGGGAYLLPSDPALGAYRLGADLRLRHKRRQPFAGAKAAEAGYIRAYTQLLEILKRQVETGLHLMPPLELTQRAA